MKKIICSLVVGFILSIQLFAVPVFAQGLGTLIPKAEENFVCADQYEETEQDVNGKKMIVKSLVRKGEMSILEEKEDPAKTFRESDDQYRNSILACGIETGKIHFWMIPYYVVNFIEFLIGIAGLIAILFLVIAGYQFVISGATDKRDAAKGTVMHALTGLVIVLVAWVVVNIIQFVLTV